MIALLLALAASPQIGVKPLLFDCVVSDVNGSQQSLAILARGAESDEDKFHDPSNLLPPIQGAFGSNDYWPAYFEFDVSSYFMKGPHEERLGTSRGWRLRIEPEKKSSFRATITVSDFGAEYTSGVKDSGFVLKGNCTWREGRRARTIFRKLAQ